MSTNDPTTRLAIFSPHQAKALMNAFDRVLLNVDSADHMLCEVRDRLTDSLSISEWLRENVSLELSAIEIIDLIEALVVMLQEQYWSDVDCQALQAVVEQLTCAVTPGRLASDATSGSTHQLQSAPTRRH